MKFNSQICTTKEQSERLLALGLKKKTADMYHTTFYRDNVGYKMIRVRNEKLPLLSQDLPAWSLHRLVEICPHKICLDCHADTPYFLTIRNNKISYINDYKYWLRIFDATNLYDNIINCIEWLIKESYFNKDYLEEKK